MAFVKTDHTITKYFNLGKGNFSVYVKANSFKDGSVELIVEDCSGDFCYLCEIEEINRNELRSGVMIAIKKLLGSKDFIYDNKILYDIERLILSISETAKKFLGRATVDYHKTECQALLVLSNNKVHGTSKY